VIPIRSMVSALTVALSAVCCGAAVALHPYLGVFVVIGLGALFVLRSRSATYISTIVLTFGALPAGLPQSLPGHLLLYEPLLIIATWMTYRDMRADDPDWRWVKSLPFVAMSSVVGFGILEGLFFGNSHVELLHDSRNLISMLMGTVLVVGLRTGRHTSVCLRAVGWTLWLSVATSVLASVGVISIVGRDLANDGTGGASRLITPATVMAVATSCVCISLWLLGSIPAPRLAFYLFPSLLLMLVSFSRNNLLAIAIVVFWTVMASRSIGVAFAAAWRGVAAVLILLGVVLATPVVPGGDWVNAQLVGFEQRVLGGISGEARARDNSAQFRIHEIQLVKPVITERPLLGHGFGSAYKAPQGAPGSFEATRAPYYVHNFYFWLALKTGVVGLLGFALYLFLPLLRSLSTRAPLPIAFAGSTVAFAGISVVAPMPIGSPTGIAFGALVGGVMRWERLRRGQGRTLQDEPIIAPSKAEALEPAI
jgi:hypothetical protein